MTLTLEIACTKSWLWIVFYSCFIELALVQCAYIDVVMFVMIECVVEFK
jgi:hypothetical protein